MAKQKRYKLRDSDRSGFTFREIELVKDGASLVGPNEYDSPPPSRHPTGGEGDVDRSGVRANSNTYAAVNPRPEQLISASAIKFLTVPDSQGKSDPNNSWVYVSGASATTLISANPQITAGRQNSIITVECISNNIVLINGSGLSLRSIFNMGSGSMITLIYNATDNLWYETSRSNVDGLFLSV